MTKFNLALLVAFMSDIVPTVTIKTPNGPVDINLSDFDAHKHEIADATSLPPLKPLDPKDQVALFGSSKQPSGWTLPSGEILQLGTVVQKAFERSSLSIEEWNKIPQDQREEMIAEVVEQMVPPAPLAFKVGHNSKRGKDRRFVILDGEGKVVGDAEYDTEEEAKAEIAALSGEEDA